VIVGKQTPMGKPARDAAGRTRPKGRAAAEKTPPS